MLAAKTVGLRRRTLSGDDTLMPLVLTLSPLRRTAPSETRTLSEGTVTLGRGTVSDWVLADPERLLSKTHCMIGVEGSRYVLTDLSTNGVFINGAREPTARDSRVFLTDGDSFRLGDYTVSVAEMEVSPRQRAASLDHRPAVSHDPLGEDGAHDPFGSEPGTMFRHPIPARPMQAFRSDDPFAPSPGTAVGRLDPDDDLFQGVAADRSWQGAPQKDDADAANHAFAAPHAVKVASFDDLDLDALLGDEPPGPQLPQPQAAPVSRPPPQMAPAPAMPNAPPKLPASQPAAQPIPLPQAALQPVARAPEAAAEPAPPPESAAADAQALLAAFLDGAGVPALTFPGQDPQATMHAAGSVLRALVEGLREVLMSRAAIKHELRVEQTMIRQRDNNALKFSITPEEAVAALLLPPRSGYQAPVAAAREACRDIQSHEMAVMAGVQSALTGLLKRFDPATLETRLAPARLDSILPAARKARIWELFCATYADIAREAEDDFQSVFGREFARAYDAQIRKL